MTKEPSDEAPKTLSNEEALNEAVALCLERIEEEGLSAVDRVCEENPELASDIRRRIEKLRKMGLISAEAEDSQPVSHASLDFMLEVQKRRESHNRYEVENELAQGGMGAILRVFDHDLRRHLAMKVILDESAGSADSPVTDVGERALSRFLEEAQISGQLEHPGIIPIHELGLDAKKRAYFTMRLVRGSDLSQVLKEHRDGSSEWTRTRILSTLHRACEAMAYVHSKGIVHRDLKPANIMVGRFGETYIMDWGLAKVLGQEDRHDLHIQPEGDVDESLITTARDAHQDTEGKPICTMDGAVIGTPAYMPPEQARGKIADIGPHSDVYAFGAILYHLLAGLPPYFQQGERPAAYTLLRRVVKGPPPPLHTQAPDTPPELAAITEKAMERDAADRYTDMQGLADDLRAFLEDRVVKAHRTGALIEFRKWIQRNKAVAASLAFALMAVIIGLSSYAVQKSKHNEEILGKNKEIGKANSALESSVNQYERMAASRILELLGEQSRVALWPRRQEQVEGMEKWILEAENLIANLDVHRATLNSLDAKAELTNPEEWQRDVLRDMIDGIEALRGSGADTLTDMKERLEVAQSIDEETIESEEADEAWELAMEEIMESPLYDGLEIEPQIGLIPLGADEESGLQEFWLWESGERPERDEETGRFVITEDTGMVFVLLPGGDTLMGASSNPADAHFDPQALPNEGPILEISLAPFFMSKYEMTQAQWMRLTKVNPSDYAPGTRYGMFVTLAHPVERVSWDACHGNLQKLGLRIPTEAQWEYGARGGTNTPWYTGREASSVEGHANLADQYARNHGGAVGAFYEAWEDGYTNHAPVGTYLPNPFGLHDVQGNVWEWCRDSFSNTYAHIQSVELKDGFKVVTDNKEVRALRGGAFSTGTITSRSAVRVGFVQSTQDPLAGVRPIRTLDD